MSTSAQAASKEDLEEMVDDLKESVRHLSDEKRQLEAFAVAVRPAMEEMLQGLTGACAIIRALEVYQGGTPDTPVNDLVVCLRKELVRLRTVAERNVTPTVPVRTATVFFHEDDPEVLEARRALGHEEEE